MPIAVTALSGASLAARGVADAQSLQMSVPGLTYANVAGNGQPRIRGVGTNLAGAGNEGAVATYVDGVYIASATASVMSFNNISQVAVLKGPQGTLFGRNATGGLIQITTKDPSHNFNGDADVTFGNLGDYGADLYMTGGLTEKVAADLAVHFDDQTQGSGKNLYDGSWVNSSETLGLRSKIKADLTSDTTATLAVDYENSRSTVPAFRPITSNLPIANASVDPYAPTFPGSTFDVNSNVSPLVKVKQWGAALTINHQFDFAKLVSITAYRWSSSFVRLDGDAGLPAVVGVNTKVPERQVSQEIRLESPSSGSFNWQVGAYYFYGKGGYGPADISEVLIIRTPQTANSYAVFGQAGYKFDDKTSLTLGLRYTIEKKKIDAQATELDFTTFTYFTTPEVSKSQTVDKPTWRIVLDHKLTPSSLLYVSYNRGFKSGGFDPGAFAPPTYFKPEVLDAYEIGSKNDFFNKRFRLNAAAFYYDYTNIQLNNFVGGTTHIYNGKSAKIYGLDMDVTAIPINDLTLTGGLSLLHSEFGDFPIDYYTVNSLGFLTGPVSASAKGKWLPNTPEYQVDLGADYRIPLQTGSLDMNLSAFLSGRWYGQPENRLAQKAYSLVNASATWFIDNDKTYSVKLWGKNLGDTAYGAQLVTQNLGGLGMFDYVALAQGRTFGATFGVKF